MAPLLLISGFGLMRQHTIRKPVSIEGIGLHSGKVARVTVSPAPADAGVVFKVRATGERIPARRCGAIDEQAQSGTRRRPTRTEDGFRSP